MSTVVHVTCHHIFGYSTHIGVKVNLFWALRLAGQANKALYVK